METGHQPDPPELTGSRLPAIARDAVASAFRRQPRAEPPAGEGYLARRGAVFVTVRDAAGHLRGCVGTLTPKFPNVAEETWRMAREAAFSDSRFSPVRAAELSGLRFEVSVLSPPEVVAGAEALDAARYGVVVSTADGRRGALLPAVEGIDTVPEQLSIARRKGAIGPNEPVRIQRFRVEKFTESEPAEGGGEGPVVTSS